ncbi:hypothetical protein H6F87_26300 [Cyanobacteria bacterium FACHB-502]|nr:hypothetical protein [Cyanobacteria bacterium FACHB-502]
MRTLTQAIFLATALMAIPLGEANAQVTPPFNPGASANGSAANGDLLNNRDLLNGGVTPPFNPAGGTQAGLQQQAQTGANLGGIGADVQQATGAVQEAGGIFNDIANIGDRIGNIGGQISNSLGRLFSQFNLNALLGVLGINLNPTFESVAGGLEGNGGLDIGAKPDKPGGGLDIGAKPDKPGGAEAGEGGSLVSRGALMLPDIDQARSAIANGKTSTTEEFLGAKTGGQGSVVIKQDLESLLMTSTTREVGEATTLSAQGQQQLRANAEAANQALTTSGQLAEDSVNQDVSQNILRNLSGQMQASQQTGTLLAIDAQMRARDDSLRNILMANTLDEIQGENIAERRMDASAYSAAITQGSQFTLPGFNPEGTGRNRTARRGLRP